MSAERAAKPNCYECKYRGEVPGSAHSKCLHPAFQAVRDDTWLSLCAMLGGGGIPPVSVAGSEISVKGHPQGIRGGWFSHPFNFDPTWLLECNGFAPKESAKAVEA